MWGLYAAEPHPILKSHHCMQPKKYVLSLSLNLQQLNCGYHHHVGSQDVEPLAKDWLLLANSNHSFTFPFFFLKKLC